MTKEVCGRRRRRMVAGEEEKGKEGPARVVVAYDGSERGQLRGCAAESVLVLP